MPRIVCIGAKQPATWKERVGREGCYRVGSVQCMNKSRYKVIALRHNEALGKRKSKTGGAEGSDEPITLEAEGVLDLEADDSVNADAAHIKTIVQKIEARHNNVVLVFGLSGTGKTASMKSIVHQSLSGARRHLDTSARESKAQREARATLTHLQTLRKSQQEEGAGFIQNDEVVDKPISPMPPDRKASEAKVENMAKEIDRRKSGVGPTPPSLPISDAAARRSSRVTFTSEAEREHQGENLASHKGHSRRQSVDLGELARRISDHTITPPDQSQGVTQSKADLEELGGGRSGRETASFSFCPEHRSAVCVPPFRGLEDKAQKCMFEMWVKCAQTEKKMCLIDISEEVNKHCRFAVHLNVNYYDEPAKAAVRVLIRDARHKACECVGTCEALFDGEWHLLQCHIVSSKDNDIDVRVDGVPLRLSISSQSDDPYLFETWQQHGILGAEWGPSRTPDTLEHFFEGSIAELRCWDMAPSPPHLLAHLPLKEGLHHNSVKEHLTQTSGDILHHTKWSTTEFPPTALLFKGFSLINVGTLGSFGNNLGGFGIELWCRTVERTRVMSLMKVTDSQKKHQGCGITLNANHKAENRPGQLTVFLRDTAGAELVATWAPSQAEELTDGKWHNIQWKVDDATTNTMTLKVDGTAKHVTYAARGHPSNFCSFVDFIALGAHNNRGKATELFDGMIRNVVISAGDSVVAAWPLKEGPGANIAVDFGDPLRERRDGIDTGLHHGIHKTIFPTGVPKSAQKHSTEWIKCVLPDEDSLSGVLQRQEDRKTLAKWESNAVKACCLKVEAVPKENSSIFLESLRDVVNDAIVDLTPKAKGYTFLEEATKPVTPKRRKSSVVVHLPDGCAPPPETFCIEELPDSVWKNFDDTDSLVTFFDSTMESLEEDGIPRGHHIWIITVGDSHTMFIDIGGVHQHPSATFDTRVQKWFAATTSIGIHQRFHACLNRSSNSVLKLFSEVGTYPMLWLRNAQRNEALLKVSEGGTEEDDPYNTLLWNESYISRLIKGYGLLDAPIWANLFFYYTTAANRVFSQVEMTYTQSVLSEVGGVGQDLAKHVLQGLARKICLKHKADDMRKRLREMVDRRRRSSAILEKYPGAGEKARRIAVVVSSWEPEDPRIGTSFEVHGNGVLMKDLLTQLDYEVYHLDSGNPDETNDIDDSDDPSAPLTQLSLKATKANVTAILKRAATLDCLLLVYIAGFAGGAMYHTPPPLSPLIYELILEEEKGRYITDAEVQCEWTELRNAFLNDLPVHDAVAAAAASSVGGKRRRSSVASPLKGSEPSSPGSCVTDTTQNSRRPSLQQRRKSSVEKIPHTRLQAGTGGAGVRAVKKRSQSLAGDEVVPNHSDVLMQHADDRRELQGVEADARDIINHDEMQQTALLHYILDEMRRTQRANFEAPAHVLLDDSALETAELNTIAKRDVCSLLLPTAPQIGNHKVVFFDTYSRKGGEAFFYAECTSGERFEGHNAVAARGVLTTHLLHGLNGNAQLCPLSPIHTKEETSAITFATLFAYLIAKMKKHEKTKSVVLVSEHPAGELIGETNIARRIIKPREVWKREKEMKKNAVNVLRPFWAATAVCLGENSVNEFKTDLFATEGIERVLTYFKPEVEVVFAARSLTDSVTSEDVGRTISSVRSALNGTASVVLTAASTAAVLTSLQDKPFAAKVGRRRSKGITQVEGATLLEEQIVDVSFLALKVTPLSKIASQPRNLLPPQADAESYEISQNFLKNVFSILSKIPALSEEVCTMVVPVFVRFKAPKTMGWKLVKELRAVGKRVDAGEDGDVSYVIDGCGGFTAEEGSVYERKITQTLEKLRKRQVESRRKSIQETEHAKENLRVEKVEREQQTRIDATVARLKENESHLTSSALALLFSLPHPDTIVQACDTLLFHSDAPSSEPAALLQKHLQKCNTSKFTTRRTSLKKRTSSEGEKVRGFNFTRQCLEWGLLDLVHNALEEGTQDAKGLDSVRATEALLKVLLSCYTHARKKFLAHKYIHKDLVRVLNRHYATAGCARWGIALRSAIVAEQVAHGVSRKSMFEDIAILLRVTAASFFAVAAEQSILCVKEQLATVLFCISTLDSHAEEEDFVMCSYLAVYCLEWVGGLDVADTAAVGLEEVQGGAAMLARLKEDVARLAVQVLNASLPASEDCTEIMVHHLHRAEVKSPFEGSVVVCVLKQRGLYLFCFMFLCFGWFDLLCLDAIHLHKPLFFSNRTTQRCLVRVSSSVCLATLALCVGLKSPMNVLRQPARTAVRFM